MSSAAPGTALYFAYVSNMCTGNLRQVAPSATAIAVAGLQSTSSAFGSAAARRRRGVNPFETGREESVLWESSSA